MTTSADREHDSDPPPRRGEFPAWVVLLAFGVGLILGGGGLGLFGLHRAQQAEMAAMEASERAKEMAEAEERLRQEVDEAHRATWQALDALTQDLVKEPQPRDLFRSMVVGKHETKLSAMLGNPDATEIRDGETCWVYVGRTINPETEKPDRNAVVRIRDGKVADVTFE